MADLIPPHGGLTEPVCRTVAANEIDAFRSEAARLPKLPGLPGRPFHGLSHRRRHVESADWADEPPGLSTASSTKRSSNMAASSTPGRFRWRFRSQRKRPQTSRPGKKVALQASDGQVVATLDVSDVFEWDKPRYIKSVYGTDRTDHPGADMVLKGDAEKTHLVGGEIRALPQPKNPSFGDAVLTPREARALVAKKGWNAVVAFQTRNPLHRAHEYALVYALEVLIREGKNAGAVLNPLIGETKGDDVNAAIRMQTYRALIDDRALGDGDSDAALWEPRKECVPDRVVLMGVDIKMFYGGPKEAVMHAIYRQNMGFTNIVIGRKHADAPYHDGTPIWGDFDAQEIFGKLKGDLKIKPVKVGFAAFYDSLGRVDLTERHAGEKPVSISGKEVRATLMRGDLVDPRIMPPSTSRILASAMKQ